MKAAYTTCTASPWKSPKSMAEPTIGNQPDLIFSKEENTNPLNNSSSTTAPRRTTDITMNTPFIPEADEKAPSNFSTLIDQKGNLIKTVSTSTNQSVDVPVIPRAITVHFASSLTVGR